MIPLAVDCGVWSLSEGREGRKESSSKRRGILQTSPPFGGSLKLDASPPLIEL